MENIENILIDLENYVKDIFEDDFSGHDFAHTIRVKNNTIKLCKIEKVDNSIPIIISLLHDVDDYKLSPNTYENKDRARSFLNNHKFSNDDINLILQAIDEISFKGKDTKTPTTIEGKIVQDADRLDSIGAIGIARAFEYGSNHKRIMFDENIKPRFNMTKEEYYSSNSTTINHFYEKLFFVKNLMNTKSGRKLAKKRDKYIHNFVDEFIKEWKE